MTSQRKVTASRGLETETTFKWVCPYCGESRTDRYAEAGGEAKAVAALRTHVVESEGGGHGPQNELPVDRDRTFWEYVRRVTEGR